MHNILIALSAAFIVAPFIASVAVPPNQSDDHAEAKSQPLHIVDKTLVAWVTVANLTQRGGSGIAANPTLQNR